MKSLFKTILFLSVLTFFITGCSSVFNGPGQRITIDSNVQGADITFNNQRIGKTPFTGILPRGGDSTITISRMGYVSKTVLLNTAIDPFFALNIFLGGLSSTGSTTDYSNGAMYRYSPNRIQIDLVPEGEEGCRTTTTPVRTCPQVQSCPPVIIIVK